MKTALALLAVLVTAHTVCPSFHRPPAPVLTCIPTGTPIPVTRAPRRPLRAAFTNADIERIEPLARLVAAELGPDAEAPLITRVALAAAILNLADTIPPYVPPGELSVGAPFKLTRIHIAQLRRKYPRLAAQDYDGLLAERSWLELEKTGFGDSVEAAAAAILDGEDPTNGAITWSDLYAQGDPRVCGFQLKASFWTNRGAIEFYSPR